MIHRFTAIKERCSHYGIKAEINEDDIMTFKNGLTSSEFSVVYNAELDDYVVLNADHASFFEIDFIVTMLGATKHG